MMGVAIPPCRRDVARLLPQRLLHRREPRFLFVGSRVVARQYGVTPRSYLLDNEDMGTSATFTALKAPGLDSVGMVSRATWVDYDGDGKLDLIIVGEWMPVRVFIKRTANSWTARPRRLRRHERLVTSIQQRT